MTSLKLDQSTIGQIFSQLGEAGVFLCWTSQPHSRHRYQHIKEIGLNTQGLPKIGIPLNHLLYILIGFSIINHPCWGTSIYGNHQISCVSSAFLWTNDIFKLFPVFRQIHMNILGVTQHYKHMLSQDEPWKIPLSHSTGWLVNILILGCDNPQ